MNIARDALTYGDRLRILRLVASAAAELRIARDLATRNSDADARHFVIEAHAAAVNALRAILASQETALTVDDHLAIDPTIKRALAEL